MKKVHLVLEYLSPLPGSLSRLLNRKESRTVKAILILRVGLVSLDLAGLVLVGIAASLLTGTSLSPESPTYKLVTFLNGLGIGDTYVVLACAAVSFFALKVAFSIILNNWMLHKIAKIETNKSSSMFFRISKSGLDQVEIFSKLEISKALIEGYEQSISRRIMALSIIVSETVLIVAVSAYLAFTDLRLLILLGSFFGLMAYLLSNIVGKRSRISAQKIHQGHLANEGIIFDLIGNFRQVASLNAQKFFLDKFFRERQKLAGALATLSSLTVLPRYLTELTLMFGFGSLIILRSLFGDSLFSPSVLAIFVAGSFRLISSLLPLQGALTMLKQIDVNSGLPLIFEETFPIADSEKSTILKAKSSKKISIKAVSYKYPSDTRETICDFSDEIKFGEHIAITGPSGSGKSTLADLILGLREPSLGSITIGGHNLSGFLKYYPGAIGYIPQETEIFTGTLIENITLQEHNSPEVYSSVGDLLTSLDLGSFVQALPEGLDTKFGDSLRKLSGGQKQRIGLARALWKNPQILVLDESTSALDHKSEAAILQYLNRLRGKKTLITIAHRGRVIAEADRVIALDRAKYPK